VWDELDELLAKPIRHESGAYLRIVATAIDTGFATQEVYNYVPACVSHRKVFAVKGIEGHGKPILGKVSPQE
jgi:phage terminase large subunit GpA-like protein